jgi:hypothetical protein
VSALVTVALAASTMNVHAQGVGTVRSPTIWQLDNEADGAVRALTPRGIAVFVLEYRLREYGHPASLQEK